DPPTDGRTLRCVGGCLSRQPWSLLRGLWTAMQDIMTANFHGAVLYGVRIGDVVFVALKPIVEAMGLEWSAQYRRVQRDPVLKEGIAIMATPSVRGHQDGVGLRLDLVHGWLFTISALRIKSREIRDKVVL